MFDRFSVCDTYFWWLSEHHEGMGSVKYARLSKLMLKYRPGVYQKGPTDREGYEILCGRNGCDDHREWDSVNRDFGL